MAKGKDTVVGKLVISPKGRVSYPYLFEKNSGGQYPSDKYEVVLLIPKTADVGPLRDAIMGVAQEAFKGKVKSMDELAFAPIRDGDLEDKQEMAGHWVIKAKSNFRPGIVGPDKRPIEQYAADLGVEPKELLYGGCYARISMQAISYEQAKRPGVTWSLRNVQWLSHGERFGGGSSSGNEFEIFEESLTSPDENF